MKQLKLLLYSLLSFTISMDVFPQTISSLLLAEYDENASKNNMQHLMKYSFKDGELIGKELIMSVKIKDEQRDENTVRFDLGENTIYRNRYIITAKGSIIDVKSKRVLCDKQESFAGFKGDSVIYYTNDIFKGKYYSVYDLKTETHTKIDNPNYKPFPLVDVEFDVFSRPFSLVRYDISGKKELLLADAGYGEANLKDESKAKQIPPIYWVDHNKTSFIYASFSKSHRIATLYKVGLDKSIEKIGVIDSIPPSMANTFFKNDAAGNLIYSCARGRYRVDANKKLVTPVVFEDIANGFQIEVSENAGYGRIIKYSGKEIAKKWCKYDNTKSNINYLAVEVEMVMGDERFPQGVFVWNDVSEKWKKIKIFELASIVGWVIE